MQNEKTQIKKCRVCGDRALAFNFNGQISCEACKAFFKRHAFRREKFKCSSGGCKIDLYTRKNCQKCRLEKCFQIGMKKELIKSNNFNKKLKNKFQNNSNNTNLFKSIKLKAKSFKLQKYELTLIEKVRNAMSIFCDENSLQIVHLVSGLSDMFNFPALYIRKIIKFGKSFTAFSELTQDDQLIILTPFFCEFHAVRFSFLFDKERDGFPILKDETKKEAIFAKLTMLSQYGRENNEQIFRQLVNLLQTEMENDETIRNLIIINLLFKPQPKISCPEIIRYNHFLYGHLLKRYLQDKYKCYEKADKKYQTLQRILLSELNIATELSKEMFADFAPGEVVAILSEIFDKT